MPTHWTYKEFQPGDGLFQGDIIAREKLLGVLEIVHKHFCDPKYLAFIVLTQTCDLVVRKSVCKAKHISLAVVRPLSALLPELLQELCLSPRPGVFAKERREDAEEFLHRVLNQNEQAQGWVYLHPDGDVGIGEPAVALLRVSISLRAKDHYDLIRSARCGRLDIEFRNKLGWLTGNLYSRIDTTDWAEQEAGEVQEKSLIQDLLDAPVGDRAPLWVPTAWITEANKKIKLEQVPDQQLDQVLRQFAPKPPLDVALGEVKKVVDQLRADFADHQVEAFNQRVDADPCILSLVNRAIVSTMRDVMGLPGDDRHWQFAEFVATDSSLQENIAGLLRTETAKFLSRKGPRQVGLFIDSLVRLTVLTDAAIARIGLLGETSYGPDYFSHQEAANLALRNLLFPQPLVEHLHCLAISCIQDSLAERVASRLVNNSGFKKSVKPE